jgi:rare lipoprotein A
MQRSIFSPLHGIYDSINDSIYAAFTPRTGFLLAIFSVVVAALSTACSSSVRFSSASPNGAISHSLAKMSTSSRSTTADKGRETSASERSSGGQTGGQTGIQSGVQTSSILKSTDRTFSGVASYYGNEFHGRKTANGERYDRAEFSAAHRTLPFGTMLKIRNTTNDRTVIVRVNDRGPWKETRILDLSLAAAEELDLVKSGTASIEATVVEVQ